MTSRCSLSRAHFATELRQAAVRLAWPVVRFVVMLVDALVPKDPNLWVFPVRRTPQWYGNPHAVFEAARLRRELRVVVLTPDESLAGLPASLNDAVCVPVRTIRGLRVLLRAGIIVIHHGIEDVWWPGITRRRRYVLNVFHGVSVKGIAHTRARIDRRSSRALRRETRAYTAMTCSSHIDRLAMCASMRLPIQDVWITGLPRNDWLVCSQDTLPAHIKEATERLRCELNGRRLILFAPTFRTPNERELTLTPAQLVGLARAVDAMGYVLGVRAHINSAIANIESDMILNAMPTIYPETQAVLLETAVLVTDYSSIWIDYLLTGRPIVGFTPDLQEYARDRGLLYDYPTVFPGTLVSDSDSLVEAVRQAAAIGESGVLDGKYETARKLFHARAEGDSSRLLVDRLLEESKG